MKFRDRAQLAWRVLSGRGEKTVATLVETWRESSPSYSETKFETLVKEGYRKNELIYACISKKANTAAQVALRVTDADGEPIQDHPLTSLLQRPNSMMTEYDLWSSIILYQDLAGRAAFEKVRSKSGQVVELWPLRPDWLLPIPSRKDIIAYYQYTPPGMPPVNLKKQDVLDFKLYDPLNLYHAYPPVAIAGRVGDVDNSETDYLKLFFEKGGVPPGILTSKQKLVDLQVEDIRRRWRERYGGYSKWLEPAILDSDASYQRTGLTFDEMGFEGLDSRNEARICMVLRVPPILIGARVGLDRATYANYKEARLAWWQDDLIPYYADLLDTLQNDLLPEFGGDVFLHWDFSRVPAIQEHLNSVREQTRQDALAGLITVNEFRVSVGLPEDENSDIFLRDPMRLEIEESKSHYPAGLVAKKRDPGEAARLRHERIIRNAMIGYFDAQKQRIAREVGKNGR
jgi:HK97 family phage portal protein